MGIKGDFVWNSHLRDVLSGEIDSLSQQVSGLMEQLESAGDDTGGFSTHRSVTEQQSFLWGEDPFGSNNRTRLNLASDQLLKKLGRLDHVNAQIDGLTQQLQGEGFEPEDILQGFNQLVSSPWPEF